MLPIPRFSSVNTPPNPPSKESNQVMNHSLEKRKKMSLEEYVQMNKARTSTVVESFDAGLLMGSSATASQLGVTANLRIESTAAVPLKSQVSGTELSPPAHAVVNSISSGGLSDPWTFLSKYGGRSLYSPGSEETNVDNVATVVESSDAGLLIGSSATASQLGVTAYLRIESTAAVPLESQVSGTELSPSPEQIRGAIETNKDKLQPEQIMLDFYVSIVPLDLRTLNTVSNFETLFYH